MWKAVAMIQKIFREVRKDNVGAFAAQAAFFLVLSAIPFTILLFSLIQLAPVDETEVLIMIEEALPAEIYPVLVPIVEEIYNNSVGILSFATITVIWSSARGVQCLSNGLNVIYDLKETRSFVWTRIRAIGYTLAFSVSIVFTIVFFIFGNVIRVQIQEMFPFIYHFAKGILSMRYLILEVFVFLLFWLILRFLPNRRTTFRHQFVPALASSVAWVLLTVGINLYANVFDGFSMYGSMTTVILMLLWIYFGMYLLLLAAEIESILEDEMYIFS